MPLQEINLNVVVLLRFSLLSIGKRKRDKFNSDKSKDTRDFFDALRFAIITLRIFNDDDFEKIKKKTNVKINIAFQIVREAKTKAQSNDFMNIVCCFNKKEKFESFFFIFNDGKNSARLKIVIL